MRRLWCFTFTLILLAACSSEDGSVNYNSGFSSYYPIETQPEITPHRQYVYYVRIDTSSLAEDGIYRFRVSRPEREEMYAGVGYQSPSASGQTTLAFLDSSKIVLYRMIDKVLDTIDPDAAFRSLLLVNDSILIAGGDTALYLLNLNNSSIVEFARGWDPTTMAGDTVAYIQSAGAGTFRIMLQAVFDATTDSVAEIYSAERPRWASVEPRLRRFVYAIPNGAAYALYTGEKGSDSTYLIAGSAWPRAGMLDFNLVIFSGPDGRFYETDHKGTFAFPFIFHYEGT